jgi:uncharacterized protein YqgC (DUF456 family)
LKEVILPTWLESIVLVLTALIMLFGLFGLVIPIFPGNVVIWVAALVYGLIDGFGTLGGWMFALITILMVAAVLADNVLMGAKARTSGAAWSSIILALVAGVVFSFVFPPIGGLIAAPLVLFLMEFLRVQDSERATRVVRGLLFGWGLAFVVRFGIGLVMIGLWVIWLTLG